MDFPFIREALTQLFSKPSTAMYPAVPAPAKPNYRGKIVFHPDKCINCNMCERVCAGQAISHVSEPCDEGERITRRFYLGSCTFCSHCASFCTHGAIELSDDYHMIATREEDLIVSGTYIKKAPIKKPAPAAAKPAAAAPATAAKSAEEKTDAAVMSAKPSEQKIDGTPDTDAPKPKKTDVADVKTDGAHEIRTAPPAENTTAAPDAEKPAEETKPKRTRAKKTKEESDAEAKPEPAPVAEEQAPAAAEPPRPRDDGKPVQDPAKCIYCTLCARNCPAGALTVDRKAKTWVLDEDLCVACGTCQGACPKEAIIM